MLDTKTGARIAAHRLKTTAPRKLSNRTTPRLNVPDARCTQQRLAEISHELAEYPPCRHVVLHLHQDMHWRNSQ